MKRVRLSPKLSLKDRLDYYSKENEETGCVEWTGAITKGGYGTLRYRGDQLSAHRAAYELEKGGIPEGMMVLHSCDNRKCIRIGHLRVGTGADNMADRASRGRQGTLVGESSPHAVLSAADVLLIREDKRLLKDVATDYGVSKSTIIRNTTPITVASSLTIRRIQCSDGLNASSAKSPPLVRSSTLLPPALAGAAPARTFCPLRTLVSGRRSRMRLHAGRRRRCAPATSMTLVALSIAAMT